LLSAQRLQIARDLHDAVGHSAGAIAVQAGAARAALAADAPHDATTALMDIETACRDLLREVRWMVGLLREDTEPPGLSHVDGLLDTARRSGLDLRVVRAGDVATVSPKVGQAAYRILQEAITNVLRHGDGPLAEVSLKICAGVLIRVSNPSRLEEAPNLGHGLNGMRERAAAVGGHVHVGRDYPDQWVLQAELPLQEVG